MGRSGLVVGRRVVKVVGGCLVEVWLGREPQDQPLQDSEEETADRPLGEPRGIQMQVTRRAAYLRRCFAHSASGSGGEGLIEIEANILDKLPFEPGRQLVLSHDTSDCAA